MASKVKVINSVKSSIRGSEPLGMAVAQRILLKKQPRTGLAKVRSFMESLGDDTERSLVHIREACYINKNNNSVRRKRKTPEESKPSKSDVVSDMTGVSKGVTSVFLNNQNGKGLKMDVIKMKECANVLKTLMKHQASWMFSQPVDPEILGIPDYFTIITKPMDMGTIKQKLEKKLYSSTHQFAEDVRLTFSNAMTYNPPLNTVHIKAKELDKIFNARWKLLEHKWRKECSITLQQPVKKLAEKETVSSKGSSSVRNSDGLIRKSQKTMGRVGVTSDGISSRGPKISSACMKNNGPCVGADDPSSHHDESMQASSDGVDSERPTGRKNFAEHSIPSKQDGENISTIKKNCHSPYMVGRMEAAIADGGDIQHTSDHSHLIVATLQTGTYIPCEQLPPTKALRAAMLKTRFVDTIFKAQQKTLLDNGEKGDPAKLKREREKLEKMQREENARIEAQMRAADEAKMKAKADRKMHREKLREAARLELEKIERTVDIDDNSLTFSELENFVFSKTTLRGLAELGLFMKADYRNEEDDNFISAIEENLEEGEIPS